MSTTATTRCASCTDGSIAPPAPPPTARTRGARRRRLVAGNAIGGAFALYLLLPNLEFFLRTGHPIGLVFAIQEGWVAVVFMVRRAPETTSHRPLDWIAAYGGWFASFLVRPDGYSLLRGVPSVRLQILGLLLWAWAFSRLARSFGIVPADRGLVTSGPYAVVRHPLYSAYLLGGIGYLIQSMSVGTWPSTPSP